ncbi:hypothetical protein CA600_12415 [Paenibacillus sp. VTT E-133280]|uniref:serine O-acetyltransferase n=1 Tax=Paenibacillus sp. VTT E-133280 TaxID=1986222 RepID=UPI000BA11061|nr:hypothetical protein [Paenibacillus sp. VTT E-133280]OZQ66056.1 hypothetical protein CA600_12415 [Paenibacillus sp. VTT E-133280]
MKRKNKHALAISTYRLGNWNYYNVKLPIIKQLIMIVYRLLDFVFIKWIGGGLIPYAAKIGDNLILPHGVMGIVIHPKTIIGEGAVIFHQVTIGIDEHSGSTDAPRIGKNVYIGSGAKIIGDIVVGNNVRIGANAVVINDIPDDCTAVGIPARVIKPKG